MKNSILKKLGLFVFVFFGIFCMQTNVAHGKVNVIKQPVKDVLPNKNININQVPNQAANVVTIESLLSKDVQNIIYVVNTSRKSKVTFSYANAKILAKNYYDLTEYLASRRYVAIRKDSKRKKYQLTVTNVKKVRKRIKIVKDSNTWYYANAKKLYAGNNAKTVKNIVNFTKNRLRYVMTGRAGKDIYYRKATTTGNCMVYARMVKLLCTMCGMKAETVAGWTSTYGHCWNKVKIGNRWYWSDACFTDTGRNNGFALSSGLWHTHKKFRRHFRIYQPSAAY